MRRPATRRDLALLAAAALVVLAVTAVFTWSRAVDDPSSWDVPLYQSFGDRMADGQFPYRDFRVEYPPGALPAFLLPSLVASGSGPVYEPELNDAAHAYARAFATLMTLLLAATVVLTALALTALRVTVGHAALALGVVGSTPLLLGPLALTRFDALPVALTAASVAALLHGRSRLAGIALGLAITAKLYPLLLVPLVGLYVWRRRGRREAWLSLGLAAVTVAVVVLPFVAIAPSGAWFSIRAQLTRGVQVESLPGNAVIALGVTANRLGFGNLGVGVAEGGTGEVRSADVTGALGQVAGTLGALAAVAVVLAVWLTAWRRRAVEDDDRLVIDCAAVVAAQLAVGRVLSPQFVLFAAVALLGERRARAVGAASTTSSATSSAFRPSR